ncbi:UNVERIFIED_CONTAM: hypothetical protein Slati_3872400 [Sesamum latifolium]|uniref:Endonuclease/exonuclease/phosphatase domain-containing protein n=1 Tax=Sesamum latifolium TaxID=2727402 RepID=A0AAW2TMF1_9LAMI
MDSLKRNLDMYGVSVDARGRSGGLGLLWNKNVVVSLLSFGQNHIDIQVYSADGLNDWRLTGFYGFPEQSRKQGTWELLRQLHRKSSLPWLCCGDFNAILFSHEKLSTSQCNLSHVRRFREVIEETKLHNLGYIGPKFTWSNNREAPTTVCERLDRAFACHRWKSRFPTAKVTHLPRIYSDHRPIVIEIETSSKGGCRSNRIRRFEAYWVKADECEKIISESWRNHEGLLNHEAAWTNMENCKVGLFQWSDKRYGNLEKKIRDLEKSISDLNEEPVTCENKTQRDKLEQTSKVCWVTGRLSGDNIVKLSGYSRVTEIRPFFTQRPAIDGGKNR